MKHFGKVIVLILAISFLFCACGESDGQGSSSKQEPPMEAPANAVDCEVNQFVLNGKHFFLMPTIGEFLKQFEGMDEYVISVNLGNVNGNYSGAELADPNCALYQDPYISYNHGIWIQNVSGDEYFVSINPDGEDGMRIVDCEISSFTLCSGSIYLKGTAYEIGSAKIEQMDELDFDDHLYKMGTPKKDRIFELDGFYDTIYFYGNDEGIVEEIDIHN